MGKNVTAETPVDHVFRTSDRDSCSRREEVEGVAVFDDAGIVNLADVALELWLLRGHRECDDEKESYQ